MTHYYLSIIGFTSFFFYTDTATTEIYTLSLHDALPISDHAEVQHRPAITAHAARELVPRPHAPGSIGASRSEEHTSELQSRGHLVCRLLLEKKKQTVNYAESCSLTCYAVTSSRLTYKST